MEKEVRIKRKRMAFAKGGEPLLGKGTRSSASCGNGVGGRRKDRRKIYCAIRGIVVKVGKNRVGPGKHKNVQPPRLELKIVFRRLWWGEKEVPPQGGVD